MKIAFIPKSDYQLSDYNTLLDTLYPSHFRPRIQDHEYLIGLIRVENNGEIQGLLSCYDNPYHKEYLMLGQFEAVENDWVIEVLFKKAKEVAKTLGKPQLLGPINGSTWNTYRYKSQAQSPYFLEAIHQDYYLAAWKKNGFRTLHHYATNMERFNANQNIPDVTSFLKEKNLTVRYFDADHPRLELERIHAFCIDLFKHNVLFSPINFDTFFEMYQPILPFLQSEWIIMIYDEEALVGLFFAIPDALDKERIIVKTIARNPAKKYKGLANIMSGLFYEKALEKGFKYMLNAYFHLDNASNRVSKNYGGNEYQRYELLCTSTNPLDTKNIQFGRV